MRFFLFLGSGFIVIIIVIVVVSNKMLTGANYVQTVDITKMILFMLEIVVELFDSVDFMSSTHSNNLLKYHTFYLLQPRMHVDVVDLMNVPVKTNYNYGI